MNPWKALKPIENKFTIILMVCGGIFGFFPREPVSWDMTLYLGSIIICISALVRTELEMVRKQKKIKEALFGMVFGLALSGGIWAILWSIGIMLEVQNLTWAFGFILWSAMGAYFGLTRAWISYISLILSFIYGALLGFIAWFFTVFFVWAINGWSGGFTCLVIGSIIGGLIGIIISIVKKGIIPTN